MVLGKEGNSDINEPVCKIKLERNSGELKKTTQTIRQKIEKTCKGNIRLRVEASQPSLMASR